MSNDKPNFQANKADKSVSEPAKDPVKRPPRKESAAVWEKITVEGEKYLSIKITLLDGKELWVKAFKNRYKSENTAKPDYLAYYKDSVNA
jgi:hypothetical protein